jgi:hypothetical protein
MALVRGVGRSLAGPLYFTEIMAQACELDERLGFVAYPKLLLPMLEYLNHLARQMAHTCNAECRKLSILWDAGGLLAAWRRGDAMRYLRRTQTVLEAVVRGAGEHVVRAPKLLEVTETLEVGCVDDLRGRRETEEGEPGEPDCSLLLLGKAVVPGRWA